MTRKNLRVYNYTSVPEQLPPSKHKIGDIDVLDAAIEGFWNEDIRARMQPIGHPQSKRFFIRQYEAARLIQDAAAKQGLTSVSEADVWKVMSSLRRVANRRGIAPKQLLLSTLRAAE